jgi:DNA-binding NarL/FixJ family response regulator
MDAPPVQYARTVDGYDIAYTACGSGPPIVWLPNLYSHLSWNWSLPHGGAYERAAQNNLLVHYDSRGQGLSSRDLREPVTLASLASDIEAVVTKLGLGRYAVFATHAFGPVALWYAAHHPDEVAGLITWNYLDYNDGREYGLLSDLATRDWPFYLHTMRNVALPGIEASRATAFLDAATNQDDFLNIRAALQSADLRTLATDVDVPTLVVVEHDVGGGPTREATSRTLAASLAKGAMRPIDAGPVGSDVAATAITTFLDGLSWEGLGTSNTTLSERELEVLRLIAEGRSNAQIAEALVISPNTVGRHVSNIFDKIGAANRAEATAYALRNGLA